MSTTSKSSKPVQKSRFSFPDQILDRYKQKQRKLDSIKANERLRETSASRSTPKINNLSRKLLKKSETVTSLSRMEKTQQVLRQSRFMPKNIKVSLLDLQAASLAEEPKEKLQENCYNIVSHRSDSPKFYPSLMQQNKVLTKTQSLPSDIELRNELLYSLKPANKKNSEVKNIQSIKDINQRSKYWLMKKQQRLEEAKALKDSKATEGCTFKPDIKGSRNGSQYNSKGIRSRSNSSSLSEFGLGKGRRSSKSFSNLGRLNKPNSSMISTPRSFVNENPYFAVTPYSKVTPIKMRLGYKHGFSSKMKAKFKPMIDYRGIRFQTS